MSKLLRDVATIHYGKSQSEVAVDGGEVPILGTGGVFGWACRGLFSGPAVLVPRKGSLGNSQYIDGPFWPVDTTYAVLPKSGSNARWLYYCLDFCDLTKLNEATGVPSISRDRLERVSISSIPESKQRRIAEILSTVDEAIEQTERLIAKQQQIKAGLMHDLFTRGVWTDASIQRAREIGSPAAATAKVGQLRPPRDTAPELYKESALGWIPKDWEVKSLSELVRVTTGRTPPSEVSGLWGGDTPFVTPADFVDNGVIQNVERSISTKAYRYCNLLEENSVLVVCIGSTIGKVSLIQKHCATNQQINATTLWGKDECRFAREAICRNIFQVRRWMGLQAVPIVKKSQFEKLILEWPSIFEREMISMKAQVFEDEINSLQLQLAKIRKQKQGLMQDLLTGKVPVA